MGNEIKDARDEAFMEDQKIEDLTSEVLSEERKIKQGIDEQRESSRSELGRCGSAASIETRKSQGSMKESLRSAAVEISKYRFEMKAVLEDTMESMKRLTSEFKVLRDST